MEKPSDTQWPPPYTVKEHPRAKRVILRFRPAVGLTITTPKGFDRRGISQILEDHRSWIEEQSAKEAARNLKKGNGDLLPTEIYLAATGELWKVFYSHQSAGRVKLSALPGPQQPCIHVTGNLSDRLVCTRLFRRWLQNEGRLVLPSWVERLSAKTGLNYARIQVRTQKSRLGSLSSRGTLSINAAILFLRRELAEYLILHELCHSRHLDHGPNFWNLLASYQPRYQALESELTKAASHFPPWFFASFL